MEKMTRIKKALHEIGIAHPSILGLMQRQHKTEGGLSVTTGHRWAEILAAGDLYFTLQVCDEFADGRAVPESMSQIVSIIRDEAADRYAKHQAKSEQHEQYHQPKKVNAWVWTTKSDTGKIAVRLGRKLRDKYPSGRPEGYEEDYAAMLRKIDALLAYDSGNGPRPDFLDSESGV